MWYIVCMKTQKESISLQLQEIIHTYLGSAEDVLFFDIESTGLSPKNASVYLIGAACHTQEGWHLHQWFAQDLSEEEAVLDAFLSFSKGFNRLVHFNGTTFDLPFLQTRCKKYGLSSPLSEMEQTDIYRRISPCKNVLKLPNCKQKTLEEYLGNFRKDPFTGGELIELYKVYRTQQDDRLLKALLLHNADDIRGMLSILPVLSYPALFSGGIKKAEAEVSPCTDYAGRPQKELLLRLELTCPLAKPLTLHADGCYFSGKGGQGLLKVPVFCGELKHYYPDYKNYSYLPDEDNAIHKSVAVYVDKTHRVPATPETCYTRKTGEFLPLPKLPAGGEAQEALFAPLFSKGAVKERSGKAAASAKSGKAAKASHPHQNNYFLLEDAFLQDNSRLMAYACRLLSCMQKG